MTCYWIIINKTQINHQWDQVAFAFNKQISKNISRVYDENSFKLTSTRLHKARKILRKMQRYQMCLSLIPYYVFLFSFNIYICIFFQFLYVYTNISNIIWFYVSWMLAECGLSAAWMLHECCLSAAWVLLERWLNIVSKLCLIARFLMHLSWKNISLFFIVWQWINRI